MLRLEAIDFKFDVFDMTQGIDLKGSIKDCNIIEVYIENQKPDFKYLLTKFYNDERYKHNQARLGELRI